MKKGKSKAAGPKQQEPIKGTQLGKGTFRIIDMANQKTVAWACCGTEAGGVPSTTWWGYCANYFDNDAPMRNWPRDWSIQPHTQHFSSEAEFVGWAYAEGAVSFRRSKEVAW